MIKLILLRIWHWRVGHDWLFVRNIYGDEINVCGGARSIYRCSGCRKEKWCFGLHGSYLNLVCLPELSAVTSTQEQPDIDITNLFDDDDMPEGLSMGQTVVIKQDFSRSHIEDTRY